MSKRTSLPSPNTKTHYISQELADHRIGNPCPTCGDHLVIKVSRFSQDPETGNVKYGGSYGVCAGHSDDTDHYELSPGGGAKGSKPRETVGSSVPRQFRTDLPEIPSGPRVVKRNRATGALTSAIK